MRNEIVSQAKRELINMAHFYQNRGKYDKAAELLDLVDRMEQAQSGEKNVVSMAHYQEEHRHDADRDRKSNI